MLIIVLTIILLSLFCIFLFRFIFFPSKQAPYINSFKKDLKTIQQLKIPQWAKIIDLWCGDARALRFFNKHFELEDITWYDINPYPILIWKIINKIQWQKNIKLYRQNFLKASIEDYDYIYMYLLPKQMTNIEEWIWQNKREKTVIISNTFQFKTHPAFQVVKNNKWKNVLFLYK